MRNTAAQTLGKRGRPLGVCKRHVTKVRQLHRCGASIRSLANRFKAHRATIDKIVAYRDGYEAVGGDVRCKR